MIDMWEIFSQLILLTAGAMFLLCVYIGYGAVVERRGGRVTNTLSTSEVMSVVSIHATVLSILFATITALAALLYSRGIDVKNEIFNKARRINDVNFYFQLNPKPLKNPQDHAERRAIMKRFHFLVTANGEDVMDPETCSTLRLTLAEQGERVLSIMSSLASNYPFKISNEWAPDGSDNIVGYGQPKNREFARLEDVRLWTKDVTEIADSYLRYANLYKPKIQQILDAHEVEYRRTEGFPEQAMRLPGVDISGPPSSNTTGTTQPAFSHSLASEFFQNLQVARGIAREVEWGFSELDEHKKKHPVSTLITFSLLAGVAFLTGVIAPLLYPQLSKLFLLGFPIAVYVILFLYLLHTVGRIFD